MKNFILMWLVVFCLVGCGPTEFREEAFSSDRIQSMTRIISKNSKVPSEIFEANYIEYRTDAGALGPSDFYFFARIKVEKSELPKWSQGLEPPYNNSTDYSAPYDNKSWWVSKSEFQKLKLYETKKYFGRFNGWFGIDESTGYIYIYTFTM